MRTPLRFLPLCSLLLAACGGGGGGSDPQAPAPPVVQKAAHIASFSAEPATLIAGGRSLLRWSVTDAQSCTLNGQPVSVGTGSQDTGALNANTRYSLQCLGAGGNDARELELTVSPAPSTVQIERFGAEPASVTAGGSSTLSWQVLRASECFLNGAVVAAAQGSQATGPLAASTRYTLSCRNGESSDSRELEVKIQAQGAAGWTRLKDMPLPTAKFGIAALDGKIYVSGGYEGGNGYQTVQIYDVASESWNLGARLPVGTDNPSSVAAGGQIYVLGGEAQRRVQIYAPARGSWVAGPALPAIRFAASAAELNGRIHLVGGWNYDNRNSQSLASHDAFDLASQSYLPGNRAPLAQARNAAAQGVIDGKFYVVGGRAPGIRDDDAQRLASVEIYTPGADAWDAGPAMPTARSGAASAVLDGKLYVLGGELAFPGVSAAVERYDPASRQWQVLAPMPLSAHGLGAVTVDGAIYVLGGFTRGGDALGRESAALYRYVPEA